MEATRLCRRAVRKSGPAKLNLPQRRRRRAAAPAQVCSSVMLNEFNDSQSSEPSSLLRQDLQPGQGRQRPFTGGEALAKFLDRVLDLQFDRWLRVFGSGIEVGVDELLALRLLGT